MSNLEHEQFFWDDFAEEYYEIQQESFTTIVEDITNYLEEVAVFPCDILVDIAGGYGKYMEKFLPFVSDYMLVDFSSEMLRIAKERNDAKNIQYIQADQTIFCMNSGDNQYDIVYSAMNPAITSIDTIKEFYRIAKKEVILVYVTLDEDNVFSRIESIYQSNQSSFQKSDELKRYLKKQSIPWYTKEFSYEEETETTKEFVTDYFEEEAKTYTLIPTRINNLFEDKKQLINKHRIHFELIRIMK